VNLDDGPNRGVPQNNANMVRRFLEQKINALSDKDPNQAAALHGLLFRIEAVRAGVSGDLFGVVIDDKGTAIVLTALLREAQPESLKVTTPDGAETTAKFVGTHPARGYTILQLDKPGAALPADLGESRPAPGMLLLSITANTGATGWMVAPAKFGKRPLDERIPLFAGDDRGGAFIFDGKGRLVALGWGRFALPMSELHRDIQWIVDNRKDVTPRQLGVRYSLVPVPWGAARNPRDAARVDAVAPGSPAEKAGLKKDDIVVSIDKKPLNQLPQIQMDLATRSGSVPLGIVRDGKEQTLELHLDGK
jgi:S1-C subfamily serine protease